MDNQTYIVVAGSGETSRNNVEALLGDYFILLKQKKNIPVLVLVAGKKTSIGQNWAAQYAKEKNIETVLFVETEIAANSMNGVSFDVSEDPVAGAINLVGDRGQAFLLWEDADGDIAETLSRLSNAGIPCFDLTNGLYELTPGAVLKAPTAPVEPVEAPKDIPSVPEKPKASTVVTDTNRDSAIRQAALDFAEAIIKALNA